jgi:hypothetical protein
MISWNTLTQPKECGGLGLRNLQSMNEACLMKMGWSLMNTTYGGKCFVENMGEEGGVKVT